MKSFIATWLAAYGAVLVILYGLQPVFASWPVWVRALVLSLLMVALMRQVITPVVRKLVPPQPSTHHEIQSPRPRSHR